MNTAHRRGRRVMPRQQLRAAPIAISVREPAQAVIQKGVVTEGILKRVEMTFRSHDPRFDCATHAPPCQMPLEVRIFDADGSIHDVLKRE